MERQVDYPELEGPMKWKLPDGEIIDVIVVGCNRDIGITIVHAENKKTYIECWNGPYSINYKNAEKEHQYSIKTWNRVFDLMIANMKSGTIWESINKDIIVPIIEAEIPNSYGYNANAESCPYN